MNLDKIYHKEIYEKYTSKPIKEFNHLLLFGSPGVGKSFLAKLIAEHYKNEAKIIYLNGSKSYSTDDLESLFSIFSNKLFKILVIDEIDYMTLENQAFLRGAMDKYTYVKIICTANYENRILTPILSRCNIEKITINEALQKKIEEETNIKNITDLRFLYLNKENKIDNKNLELYNISSLIKILKDNSLSLFNKIKKENIYSNKHEIEKLIIRESNNNVLSLKDNFRHILKEDISLFNILLKEIETKCSNIYEKIVNNINKKIILEEEYSIDLSLYDKNTAIDKLMKKLMSLTKILSDIMNIIYNSPYIYNTFFYNFIFSIQKYYYYIELYDLCFNIC